MAPEAQSPSVLQPHMLYDMVPKVADRQTWPCEFALQCPSVKQPAQRFVVVLQAGAKPPPSGEQSVSVWQTETQALFSQVLPDAQSLSATHCAH